MLKKLKEAEKHLLETLLKTIKVRIKMLCEVIDFRVTACQVVKHSAELS